ncbi:MAG TPA: helix-turn-helix transcriptional regulator [Streptosporangiaceae bacterium]
MSDNELGTFLRIRREAVTPAEVGLPPGGRRRTPGLRRAELATLAGVSVDYLTRLEQGRDRHPSAQVLAALADTLGLSSDDRFQLLMLAKAADGGGSLVCPGSEPPAQSIRPSVRAVLDRLEPSPAYVVNRLQEVLAHTDGFARLAGPIGLLDGRPPNIARFVFTDARARDAYPDWAHVADEHIAHLKLDSARDEPHLAALVDDLTITAGAPFTDRWSAQVVAPSRRTGIDRVVHPEVGELRLASEVLELSDDDHQRLVVLLPADEATATALDRLHHTPLRAVPS